MALLRAAELHHARAGELIAERASGWSLERMPALDVLVMRLAVAEMLTMETPTGVVLAEAVELATRYSTDTSGRFRQRRSRRDRPQYSLTSERV